MRDTKEDGKISTTYQDHETAPVSGDDFSLDEKDAARKTRCQNRYRHQK
jgi:hypothetical protein